MRSRYKRQLIWLNMKKKWPTRAGNEDSRPIFFCKRFSYDENALYCNANFHMITSRRENMGGNVPTLDATPNFDAPLLRPRRMPLLGGVRCARDGSVPAACRQGCKIWTKSSLMVCFFDNYQ